MGLFWTIFFAVGSVLAVYKVFTAIRYKQQLDVKRMLANESCVHMLDKEKIDILLALFAVRCAEIYCIYWYMRDKQKSAKEGSWVDLFLEDCLNSFTPDYIIMYGGCDENEKIEKANKEKAKILSESRFYNDYNDGIRNRNAIKMAVISYIGAYRLGWIQGIRNYGFLKDQLSALIEQYEMFDSISLETFVYGEFYHSLQAAKAESIDHKIKSIWHEIILHLKSLLILMQVKKDNSFDVDKLLKDIAALEALEFNLRFCLSQKNAKETTRSSFSYPDYEKLIHDVYKNHPINQIGW